MKDIAESWEKYVQVGLRIGGTGRNERGSEGLEQDKRKSQDNCRQLLNPLDPVYFPEGG